MILTKCESYSVVYGTKLEVYILDEMAGIDSGSFAACRWCRLACSGNKGPGILLLRVDQPLIRSVGFAAMAAAADSRPLEMPATTSPATSELASTLFS